MGLKPLTREQYVKLNGLVSQRKILTVPADVGRAEAFIVKASRRLEEVDKLSWPEGRYNYAYDAAHERTTGSKVCATDTQIKYAGPPT